MADPSQATIDQMAAIGRVWNPDIGSFVIEGSYSDPGRGFGGRAGGRSVPGTSTGTATGGTSSSTPEPERVSYPYSEGATKVIEPVVERTNIRQTDFPSIESIGENLYTPTPKEVTSSAPPPIPSYLMDAFMRKSELGEGDFGIPDDIREQMKVQAAKTITPQYEAQKEAAKRQLARMGLLDDSASLQANLGIDQARLSEIADQYSGIDIEAEKLAKAQELQNLSELGTLASQMFGTQESGRQFNAAGMIDLARLDRATQEMIESQRMKRAVFQEAVAEFLEEYELERFRIEQGLVGDAITSSLDRQRELSDAIGDQGSGFGLFA